MGVELHQNQVDSVLVVAVHLLYQHQEDHNDKDHLGAVGEVE